MTLPTVLEFTKQQWTDQLRPGDWALDATVGNGHDTLALSRLAGETGRVIGFDIQQQAIESTQSLLKQAAAESDGHLLSRVDLICKGHEKLTEGICEFLFAEGNADLDTAPFPLFKVIAFNLGYLPGGEKTVITQTDTTVTAIRSALQWLVAGGILSVVAYPGHPGGGEEAIAVTKLLTALPRRSFQVIQYKLLNTLNPAPFLLLTLKQ